jgi:hypothetical protein
MGGDVPVADSGGRGDRGGYRRPRAAVATVQSFDLECERYSEENG